MRREGIRVAARTVIKSWRAFGAASSDSCSGWGLARLHHGTRFGWSSLRRPGRVMPPPTRSPDCPRLRGRPPVVRLRALASGSGASRAFGHAGRAGVCGWKGNARARHTCVAQSCMPSPQAFPAQLGLPVPTSGQSLLSRLALGLTRSSSTPRRGATALNRPPLGRGLGRRVKRPSPERSRLSLRSRSGAPLCRVGWRRWADGDPIFMVDCVPRLSRRTAATCTSPQA